MHKYLPSKRFIYIILSIVIALIIIFVFSLLSKPKSNILKPVDLATKAKIQEFMVLDSDQDGLKDWEEALYKTDPQKSDTDGDGTSDYDELKANRDPLLTNTASAGKTPTDKIDEKIIAEEKKIQEEYNKLNETDKISRTLFSNYLATKKMGSTLTDSDINSIVQNTLTQLPTITFHQYSLTDIKISPIIDLEAVKKYGNDIAGVILADLLGDKILNNDPDFYGFAQMKNLLQVMDSDAGDAKINQALAELTPIINQYQILINDLLKVPVPSSWAENHLALINAFELVRDNLKQVKDTTNNIMVTLPLLNFYPNNVSNLLDILTATARAFMENPVIFTSTDLGYIFFNGIMTAN